ncbi:hypothetical protein [Roseateles sp. P5_E1]
MAVRRVRDLLLIAHTPSRVYAKGVTLNVNGAADCINWIVSP